MINSKTLKINEKSGVTYISFPKITAAGGAVHAFSTRLGGVSRGQFSTLSFATALGDEPEAVLENYDRFASVLGMKKENCVLSHQTHTANLRVVTAADMGKGLLRERDYSDIDGLITNDRGVLLVTQYADCTPLAFYDPVKKVVATSHAGWRSTVAQIGKKTVELMRERFNSNPSDIICGIGPCISKCCYEVDDPVINEINKLPAIQKELCYSSKGNGKYMLDLKEVNREILLDAGILEENIDVADLCTCCLSDVFHSHRATGGKRGTLALMIGLV